MTDADKARVREILVAAMIPEHQVEWMVESCPSVEVAEEYYSPHRMTAVDYDGAAFAIALGLPKSSRSA